MRYYSLNTVTTHTPRGSVTVRAGSLCTQATYDKFSKTMQQRCFIPAKNAPRAKNFTEQEFQFLVDTYLTGASDKSIVQSFYEVFTNHPKNGGVECQLRIIAGCDNKRPEDNGLEHPAISLLKVMLFTAPSRFA